jgi:sugar O-acyltransferase (sialic acid O-acetyltransferase NeuD family)
MLSDVYDCIKATGKQVTRIVLNMPEQKRERTKDFETRLRYLNERPLITRLDDFAFITDEEYFIVPTTPKKHDLIEFLRRTYNMHFSNLIHPTAYISPYSKIGQGIFIGAMSVIGPGCLLEDHVFVNRGVTVGHDTVLHEYVRLNPGCNIAGHVEIFDGAMIGLGASINEELVVGKGAVVAAGAVVIKDVQKKTMVAGVPAVVKKIYEE